MAFGHAARHVVRAGDHGIVAMVAAKLQTVVSRQKDYPVEELLSDRSNRLLAAVMILHRTRMVDLYIREQVLILWLIEGLQRLRVHSGICYLYGDKGSFETYNGLPSEHIFHRIKSFLLVLEGMFRLLPRQTARTDDGVWTAMVNKMNEYESEGHGSRNAPMQRSSHRVV